MLHGGRKYGAFCTHAISPQFTYHSCLRQLRYYRLYCYTRAKTTQTQIVQRYASAKSPTATAYYTLVRGTLERFNRPSSSVQQ